MIAGHRSFTLVVDILSQVGTLSCSGDLKIFRPRSLKVFSEKRQLMKFVGIFQLGIFRVGIFPGEIFLEPKNNYQKKHLPDNSNHFVRHYENVSSNFMSNINSLNEDIVLSAQNVYIRTADKILKKVCNVKRTIRCIKTNNGSTKRAQ